MSLSLRADLRSRRRAWLLVSLLIGVAYGLAIAVVAAAERTETVMDRYFEASRARDLLVAPRPAVQHGHGGGGQRSRSLGPSSAC